MIEVIKNSLKGTTEDKEPAYNLNTGSLGLRDLEYEDNSDLQIYKNQGVNRFSNFANIANPCEVQEENEPFERD